MGALADIFSYGDSLKRKVGDFARDPAGSVQQFVGSMADDLRSREALEQQAGWGLGRKPFVSVLAPQGGPSIGQTPSPTAVTPGQRDSAQDTLASQATQQALAGTFGGSKTANPRMQATLPEATHMLDMGVDPQKVWTQTGWAKAPWDGRMRYEIPDNTAVFNNTAALSDKAKALQETLGQQRETLRESLATGKVQPDMFPRELTGARNDLRSQIAGNKELLNDPRGITALPERGLHAPLVYEHPQLYQDYPALADMPIKQDVPLGQGVKGQLASGRMGGPQEITISQYGLQDNPGSTSAHEMQHGIQDLEKFSSGGSPSMFTSSQTPIMQPLTDLFGDLGKTDPDGEAFTAVGNELNRRMSDPYGSYQRLGGEAEARLTQSRLNLTPDQRAQQYPFDPDYFKQATGVDLSDLIDSRNPAANIVPAQPVQPDLGGLTQAIQGQQ